MIPSPPTLRSPSEAHGHVVEERPGRRRERRAARRGSVRVAQLGDPKEEPDARAKQDRCKRKSSRVIRLPRRPPRGRARSRARPRRRAPGHRTGPGEPGAAAATEDIKPVAGTARGATAQAGRARQHHRPGWRTRPAFLSTMTTPQKSVLSYVGYAALGTPNNPGVPRCAERRQPVSRVQKQLTTDRCLRTRGRAGQRGKEERGGGAPPLPRVPPARRHCRARAAEAATLASCSVQVGRPDPQQAGTGGPRKNPNPRASRGRRLAVRRGRAGGSKRTRAQGNALWPARESIRGPVG